MKTGRVRKKARAAPKPKPPAPSRRPIRPPPGPAARSPKWIFGILFTLFVCFVLVMVVLTLRGGANEWVRVTQTDGMWTTTVVLFAPQVQSREMWETDCASTPNAAVRSATCILKDTETYQERVVDDYQEYAYDIYYEETTDQVYQAQGTNFVTAQLGSDDWWEGDKHYRRQEELDRGSCTYSNYTLWIDDPQDRSQQIEVYLSQCEVWDHVVVQERVYDQKRWCLCDVTTLAQVSAQSEQGAGLDVRWPRPVVPAGGQTERTFQGQVTFSGDDFVYTVSTDDPARYRDYLTNQYYIGLKDGKPVTVSQTPRD